MKPPQVKRSVARQRLSESVTEQHAAREEELRETRAEVEAYAARDAAQQVAARSCECMLTWAWRLRGARRGAAGGRPRQPHPMRPPHLQTTPLQPPVQISKLQVALEHEPCDRRVSMHSQVQISKLQVALDGAQRKVADLTERVKAQASLIEQRLADINLLPPAVRSAPVNACLPRRLQGLLPPKVKGRVTAAWPPSRLLLLSLNFKRAGLPAACCLLPAAPLSPPKRGAALAADGSRQTSPRCNGPAM